MTSIKSMTCWIGTSDLSQRSVTSCARCNYSQEQTMLGVGSQLDTWTG